MSTRLSDLISTFESLWPLRNADDWDAPGLVVGDRNSMIERVLLSVDATVEVLEEAVGCDLLLSHHPALLRGIKTADGATAKGKFLTQAVQQKTAVYAAHTNADVVPGGVSDCFAKALGLTEITALVPLESHSPDIGHGRIGITTNGQSLGQLARQIASIIPATASGIRVAGSYDQVVETVALCGGAGDAFIEHALAAKADVYITSDLRHHVVQEALESAGAQGQAFSLIDVSHWAAEWLWLETAAAQLRQAHPSVEFVVSDLRTDPWHFAITQ